MLYKQQKLLCDGIQIPNESIPTHVRRRSVFNLFEALDNGVPMNWTEYTISLKQANMWRGPIDGMNGHTYNKQTNILKVFKIRF